MQDKQKLVRSVANLLDPLTLDDEVISYFVNLAETTAVDRNPMKTNCSIIILTCPKTASRIEAITKSLLTSIKKGSIFDIHIISSPDKDLKEYTCRYSSDEQKWYKHIDEIWPILALNIYRMYSRKVGLYGGNKTTLSCILSQDPKTIFPYRELRKEEISIAARHMLAAAKVESVIDDRICLILEDDAHLREDIELKSLTSNIDKLIESRRSIYIDLCDHYIPNTSKIIKQNNNMANKISFKMLKIGITRTLMAYSITPALARIINETDHSFTLPIDMHLQYLLKKHKVPGLTLETPVFKHMSKVEHTGVFRSSISDREVENYDQN